MSAPESTGMSNIHIGQPWRQCAAPMEFRQGGWRWQPSQTPTPTSPFNRNRRRLPPFFKAQALMDGSISLCCCWQEIEQPRESGNKWTLGVGGVVRAGRMEPTSIVSTPLPGGCEWPACVCLESKERLGTWRDTRFPHPFIILLVCLGTAPGIVSRHFSATTTPASSTLKWGILLSFFSFF